MSRPAPIRTVDHPITPEQIDEDAAKVLRRLNQFGHEAFLVGGGVRDLMLGIQPKDYDVVTSATPNEVRDLFNNCRLIGRRFRLAHILFSGGKIIECATFRAKPPETSRGDLIVDDNEFGTPDTDAQRRDFTVNGLFYDQQTTQVIDYVGGLHDLERRVLCTIGEPAVRFREDPVRMLRAVKFMARLDLDLDPANRAAIESERTELTKSAIPRLYEEIIRMLKGGAAARSFELLEELGLLELMLPEFSGWLRGNPGAPEALKRTLGALDDAIRQGASASNGMLITALYWPIYRDLVSPYAEGANPKAMAEMAQILVSPAAARLRMPRRDLFAVINALERQYRHHQVLKKKGRRVSFVREQSFPEFIGLLHLRTVSEGLPQEPLQAWQDLALEHRRPEQHRPRRGRRRPRRR
ncbi:MAG: polynucleotide adenylyltransferase PcnB [Bradymonadia bacterium]